MIVLTIIAFIIILSLIVLVHELGHFLSAKKAGITVNQFAFGFPPKLWSKKIGETEYVINAIPLGGYVSLLGEDGIDSSPKSLSQASAIKKTLVMSAGIIMNLLLAWLLLMIIIWLPAKFKGSGGVFVVAVEPHSAASAANFQAGDILLRVNGNSINGIDGLQKLTENNKGEKTTIDYRRFGIDRIVVLKLGNGSAPLGVAVEEVTLAGAEVSHWWQAPWVALKEIGAVVYGNLIFIKDIITSLFGAKNGANLSDLSGPVGIYGMVAQFVALGWVYIVMILAQLSLAVGIFNLIPLPALDGGHLLFIALNKLFGEKIISSKVEEISHMVGFSVLILLFVLVTWSDVAKLIK